MTEGTKLTSVIIGCGRIGVGRHDEGTLDEVMSHAGAYRRNSAVELVGLVDDNKEAAARASQHYNTDFHDSLTQVKEIRPDIVSICTPDHTHAGIARWLLEHSPPKVLIIEKPVALASSEAKEIAAMANCKQCTVLVNYVRRFSKAFQLVTKSLRSGELGKPLTGRFVYGKGLMHNGTHALDLMRWWLGDPVGADGLFSCWGPDGDPTWSGILTFSDNLRVMLQGFDERIATVFEFDVLTDIGRFGFRAGGREWYFCERATSPYFKGYTSFEPAEGPQNTEPFQDPFRDVLDCLMNNAVEIIQGRAEPFCSAVDGIQALMWAEAMRGNA